MFVTTYNGNVYKVKFRYEKSRRKQRIPDTVCSLLISVPVVTFSDGSNEMETSVYEVKVGYWYKDEPNKNTGRKYALASVLEKALPGIDNKPIRTHLWNTYWAHRGNKGYH
jgi:hypothetical protein